MAHFILSPDRSLMHFHADQAESLGRAEPEVTDAAVLKWLSEVAAPLDRITTPEGTFVLMPAAKGPPRRTFNQPPATSHLS